MESTKEKTDKIKSEIEKYFGFFPPFFGPALNELTVIESLWDQTLFSVFKNPIPPLFREKLMARLSRFCSMPYELMVHGCSLRPLGKSASSILSLLKKIPPGSETDLEDSFQSLSKSTPLDDWPQEGSQEEKDIFRLAEFTFLEPNLAEKSRTILNKSLGSTRYENLRILLSHIKTAHFWTEYHPEISIVADKRVLDNLDPLCEEEPLLRDFFTNYKEIIQQERKTLGTRLSMEIAQRRKMQEELTRYAADMEESRDRMQDQASQLAYQAEELYKEIAERKQVEEKISVYMEIVKNMPIGLNVWRMEKPNDPTSFRLIATNPAVKRFTGITLESSIGKEMKEIFPYLTEIPHIYAEVIRTGKFKEMGESNYGGTDQIPEGIFTVRVFPLPNSCVGVSYEDITERKNAEEELAKARDAALELARIRSEFLANMSHEIRTPLNAIIGMTNLLMESHMSDQQKEFSMTICNAGDALLGIINQILDFSKIESGKMNLEAVDFNLRNIMEGAVELVATRAQAKGLEIGAMVEDNLPTDLKGDPTRLRQIFINLLINAVKFTEKGEILIKASVEKDDGLYMKTRIEVTDTGIGISPSAKRRLFQAFSQADASTTRKYGGTGLGLAISKRLVELMGGEIGLESEQGKGSTFWMTIRFEKQFLGSVGELAKVRLTNVNVLILDHNATNRRILKHHLDSLKMRSDAVANEKTALKMIQKKASQGDPYQFIILDMEIPGMGALAFALKIKSNIKLSSTKLIALTSMTQPIEKDVLRAAGIIVALTKPVKQSALFDCLASYLGKSPPSVQKPIPPKKPVVTKPSKKKSFRILVVEDNPVNQRVAQLQLEKFGYSPELIESGKKAIESVKNKNYDLIFMDCQMPEMDGYETTQKIRKFEGEDRHTPIVAMTANAMDGDKQKCMEAGMDDYLTKPVKMENLTNILTRWDALLDASVLKGLRDMAGGHNKLLADVVSRYLEDAPKRLKNIQEALKKKDADTLEKASHSLKGSSGNVGAKGIWALCEKIETLARDNKPEQTKTIVEELVEAFQELKPALEKEKMKG